MTMRPLSRRQVLGGMSAAALGVALVRVPNAGAQDATPAASPVASYPVTISHIYGETTIEARPERIVTLSWINQDVVIALGETPVGIPFQEWGCDAEGFLPWTREALADREEMPEMLEPTVELPFEQIVGLNPDVIIAVFSGITQDEYDLLTAIAPTVAYPVAPFGTSWQDTTTIIGQILGESAAAEQLVEDTTALLTNAAVDYPQIAGKTFVYGTVTADEFSIYTTIDSRVQLLSTLGMEPSDYVKSLDQSVFFVPVSLENANEIEGDILIFWFGTQEEADAAAALPTMSGIPAFANGAYAPVVGATNVMASSAPSPLSIPYIVDTYVPQLAAAADKVPS